MAYKIIVTKNAEHDFEEIISHIRKEWSDSIAHEFTLKVISAVDILSLLPFIGVKSEKYPSIRRIVITRQNTLYYKVIKKQVILLKLFDNRRNPGSNPY